MHHAELEIRLARNKPPRLAAFDFGEANWQSSRVVQLQPPDSHHLAAVKGWLELHAFKDAARELESIRPEFRDHPDVLEVRWALAANAGNWQEAHAISVSLKRRLPEKPEGWIYEGSALTELNRHADAHAVLFQGHQRFPRDEILAYDLACVCCTLGREDEAVEWIRKAIALAGDELRQRALQDPDLERVHGRLRIRD
jgi:predicted Zn-dependent protease